MLINAASAAAALSKAGGALAAASLGSSGLDLQWDWKSMGLKQRAWWSIQGRKNSSLLCCRLLGGALQYWTNTSKVKHLLTLLLLTSSLRQRRIQKNRGKNRIGQDIHFLLVLVYREGGSVTQANNLELQISHKAHIQCINIYFLPFWRS